MILRLYIDGYKSLRRTTVKFGPALSVIYGANAAGKSNLLDALDFLARCTREDSILQALQAHRGSRALRPLPTQWFFTLGAEATSKMIFEVDFELRQSTVDSVNQELEERETRERLSRAYTRVSQSRLRYRLVIEYLKDKRLLQVVEESLAPLTAEDKVHVTIVPYARLSDNKEHLSVKLERQSRPRSFPLPRNRSLLSEIRDVVNHPHLVAAARELASIRIYYIEPTTMRTEVSDIEAADPGANGESLASFYHWLRRVSPVRFKNLQRNLQRLIPGFQSIDIQEASDGFLELRVEEEHRGPFPASLLSEGTLRLLCLLGILATPEPPFLVGYEEPENGVHPARLREMLEMLKNSTRKGQMQLLLTTHSATVLEILQDQPMVVCSREAAHSAFREQDTLPLFAHQQQSEALDAIPKQEASLGERVRRGDLG